MSETLIRFSESAFADLEDLVGWYETQGIPDVGSRIIAEIMARIETLGDLPDSGRSCPSSISPLFGN